MADAGHGSLRGVPFPITNPERIPAQRYYDEEFFELERQHLWPRVWQMACRLEEIPEVGDWVEYKLLDWSVIVIRTNSGIKAFHNSCRHRGVQLVSGQGNCEVQGIQCPFHGWRWNMNGENTFVFKPELFSDENLERGDLNLISCRVELWGGCAFINFDDNAAPLMEHIQPYADRLDTRNVEQMKMEWWVSTVLPTNWKLAMEAFMEGYHTMRTHPQLLHPTQRGDKAPYGPTESFNSALRLKPYKTSREMVEAAIHQMKTLSIGMGGMIHATDIAVAEDIKDKVDLPEDIQAAEMLWHRTLNDEITKRSRARGVPIFDLNQAAAKHMISPVQFCFPHYFLLPVYGNASSYRIRPLTPETCLFELYSLTLMPEGHKQPRLTAPEPIPHDDPRFPPIPLQDYSNLPLQQLGLHARGFEYMRLARDVEGLISNYHRLIDGFLSGVEQDKLVQATRIVSSPFEVAIDDIGF